MSAKSDLGSYLPVLPAFAQKTAVVLFLKEEIEANRPLKKELSQLFTCKLW